jgi:hypothetical protein
MKLPPETISPYLIPQSNQESFTTSASTNSGHSVHQTNVGEVQILLQKSFCTRDQNFFWLYTRLSCKDVGDLIA